MAWSPVKDKGAIKKFGGGVIRIREVSDDGATISTTDTAYHDIGYIQSHKFQDNTPFEDIYDETGGQVASDEGNRVVKITGTLMQTDMETLDVAKDTRGLFYRAYVYNGIINGKHQEIFCGICRVSPMVDIDYPGARPTFEISVLKNDAAITIATAELATIAVSADAYPKRATSTTLAIAANEFYTIVETAVT